MSDVRWPEPAAPREPVDKTLPCDHCKDKRGRTMLCVQVRSHEPGKDGVLRPARVNMHRYWCFCSVECRKKWYGAATDEDLVQAEHRDARDRFLQAIAIHVDVDETRGTVTETLREVMRHETHDALNADWKAAAPSVTRDVG